MSTRVFECAGCTVSVRRYEGPWAAEFDLHVSPQRSDTVATQAAQLHRALLSALDGVGASFANVVSEFVFLGHDAADGQAFFDARGAAINDNGQRPATTIIKQPPLDANATLAWSARAIVPREAPLKMQAVEISTSCDCPACCAAHAVIFELGNETHLYAGGLCAAGSDAHDQTRSVFELAESVLAQADMTFTDVARTWLHLRDIKRDYAHLNVARRAFFKDRGVELVPASTGIEGAPVSAQHPLCLGFYALASNAGVARSEMSSPLLNSAADYGADFIRGMRVDEANKSALYLSGTASVDERGDTVHVGDIAAQADRMLRNVQSLLNAQGAGFGDIVSAITYLKSPGDAAAVQSVFKEHGFAGFPNALVVAPVCRDNLLCETELLAVLPPRC